MITIENLKIIIELIPAIFSYFVPGATFILIYQTFLNENFDNKHIVPSVIISYCICTLEDSLLGRWTFYYNYNYIFYFISGLFWGLIFCHVVNSEKYRDFVNRIGISPPSNIYLNSIGIDEKANLIVYTSDGRMYIGHPVYWNGEWLTLSSYYEMYKLKDGNTEFSEDILKDRNKTLNISMIDIKRFEAIYDDDSIVGKSFFK